MRVHKTLPDLFSALLDAVCVPIYFAYLQLQKKNPYFVVYVGQIQCVNSVEIQSNSSIL